MHFQQSKKSCVIVGDGERKMRAEQIERLKMETKSTENKLEKLEREFEEFEREIKQNKEIVRLARLVVFGKLETNLLTKKYERKKIMPQTNFKVIEKKLEKKSAELIEVKGLRQKLFEKEKEISAEIEKLKNQKIELIFQQVKKEMKNEKLEITSEAIMPLLEVLRNSTATGEEIENDVTAEKSLEVLHSNINSEVTQK